MNSSANGSSSRVQHTTAASLTTTSVTAARPGNTITTTQQPSAPRSTPVTRPEVVAAVEAAVSTVVEPDLNPIDLGNVAALAQQTQVQPGLVDNIFKTLFKRPLGKDPVVAFRGLALLHVLLRDGSSEVTVQSVTHDGFLGWVEASWSRERIQSRPAHKAHRLSHCFAVGELAWYAAFLRRRAAFFTTYTALFSPHWTVRGDALSHTSENHRALRSALLILEGAASVIKRIVSSSDPAVQMKRSASLPLVADIAYAYRACCWLYATAHQSVRRNMQDDLDSAHHATRSVFRVVMAAPLVAEQIPPKLVLNLDENPPRNFQLSATPTDPAPAATAPTKKKKSRRKKSVETVTMEEFQTESTKSDTTNPTVDSTQTESNPATKGATKSKSTRKKKERAVESTVENPIATDSSRDKRFVDPEDNLRSPRRTAEPPNFSKSKDTEEVRPSTKKSKKRGTRKKKSKRSKDESSSESDSESESGSDDGVSKSRESKKSSKKKGSGKAKTEKTVQVPPPRKAPQVVPGNGQGGVVTPGESREGSKEAIAAAAMGKKTPQMNSSFEVAPYEVQFGRQIGSGSFGVVYTATFRGRTVAVKKIHAHALRNSASISEFQSEVAVLCTLKHPNILAFMGACTKPPNLMIITEYMGRGTLFDVLHQSQQRITWPMRRKFALDTCRGMRYLHDSKLLHRDLKSSNLMLDDNFNTKVGDFGLTRTSAGTAAVQMTGQCGTFQYMAVEVLSNKPYSEKADVFSFGILLWEMVARKLPYFGMQPMQVGMAVVHQGLRPTIPPKTPSPLAKLMRACWDSDPMRRPSFAQLVEMLEAMPE